MATVARRSIAVLGWSSLAGAVTFVALTRRCKISPVSDDDYIYSNTIYARLNPNNSPVTQDICSRKVPLSNIQPALLEREGKLVEAFCAGIWSGVGYSAQRRYLEEKYRGPNTANQLWDKEQLRSSTYDVGTSITDHFQVVSKTPESIMLRGGDSPNVQGPRDADGLLEVTAVVNESEAVAEFGLKCVFFNSASGYKNPNDLPMPWYVQWLHQLYDKVLVESAIRNVTT